jgi:predicted lipoprotein with Yx(FWY)xxD motif
MNRRINLTIALVGLGAGLAGTAACGTQAGPAAGGALVIPVAAKQTTEPPFAPAEGPGEPSASASATFPAATSPAATSLAPTPTSPAATEAPDEDQPVPEPTVAKTQKWVKIMSGPSATDIKPGSKLKGTHDVELNATESATVGTYLADGAGRTLYVFDNDTAKPPKSTCNGSCATAWPPLLIKSPGKIFPKGVNPKILGYVERADHTCQVTVNGHPVYFFVADAKAGDINGQGVNGKWFAVRPDGGKTSATPVFPTPSATK